MGFLLAATMTAGYHFPSGIYFGTPITLQRFFFTKEEAEECMEKWRLTPGFIYSDENHQGDVGTIKEENKKFWLKGDLTGNGNNTVCIPVVQRNRDKIKLEMTELKIMTV